MSIEVAELRKGDRFVFVHPAHGTFGPADVAIVDVGLAGAQLEHPQALRIGTVARLHFREGDVVVSTQGKVIWSHFTQTPKGLVYRSGIRIQPDTSFAAAVNVLFKSGIVKRDTESLERKRQRLLERQKERESAKVKPIPTAGGIS